VNVSVNERLSERLRLRERQRYDASGRLQGNYDEMAPAGRVFSVGETIALSLKRIAISEV